MTNTDTRYLTCGHSRQGDNPDPIHYWLCASSKSREQVVTEARATLRALARLEQHD